MTYIGRSSDGFGLLHKYRWVASGGETSIGPTLADSNGNQLRFSDKNLVVLFKNGTKLDQTAYNLNTANTISGLTALSASDILEAHVFDTFSIATFDTVPSTGGTFSNSISVTGTVTATSFSGDGSNLTNLPAAGMPTTGGTFTGDVTFEGSMNNRDVTWDKSDQSLKFNNSVKAKFGPDYGFEIYESQYGGRIVETSGNIEIRNETDNSDISFIADNQNGGNATYLKLDGGDGEVQLWHAASGSSSVKLTTKSTGVDVTGTVNATAFSGDGSALTNLPSSGSAADDITTGDAAVTLSTTSGNITIDAQQSDSDIIFKGTDNGVDTTFLTIDGSDAGALLPNKDIKMPTGGKITTANSGAHLDLDSYEGIKLWSRDSDGVAIEYSWGSHWTPVLKFNRRSFGSNPQGVGRIEFNGRKRDNGGGNETDQQYGYIQVSSSDTDTGEASGKMSFYLARDDASKRILELDTQRADWPHSGGILLASDMDIGWYGGNANGTITYLTVAHGNPWSMSDDVTLVLPSVDGTIITTGNLDDATFTDITAKSATGAKLKLQTSDTSVIDGEALGAIEFNAPNETGTDAIVTAAAIVAEADATFNYSTNKTDLVFKLGSSEAATEKVRFTHEGDVEIADGNLVVASGKGIDFSATSDGSSASFSELFDDYEEGVFGTSITTETSGTVTLNGSYNNMRYTKVGRLVTINGDVRISSTSSPVGGLKIAIPFATQNTGHSSSGTVVGSCITHSITKQTDQVGRFVVVTGDNLSYIMLQYETTASRFQPNSTNLGLGANDEIVFTMTYTAA